ncbi:hypothetical protein HD806DRAFT_76478 [Xylariaceae sp. AK1471]|nr:hypothetical protein HD806DRAFT_76478 [Xylariaceae sp. AK1471]
MKEISLILCNKRFSEHDENLFGLLSRDPRFKSIRSRPWQDRHHWFICGDPNADGFGYDFYLILFGFEVIENYDADTDESARAWLWNTGLWSFCGVLEDILIFQECKPWFDKTETRAWGSCYFWDLDHLMKSSSGKLPSVKDVFDAVGDDCFIPNFPLDGIVEGRNHIGYDGGDV